MSLPAIFLGIILSSLYGAAFHLFRDGGLARFLYYLVLAWIGFWTGQFISDFLGISLLRVGQLNLVIATIVCWLFLGIGHWLSLVEIDREKKPRG